MTTEAEPSRTEEFWEDLLAFIEEGRVIPVVGAELLTVAVDGQPKPLYRVVAERLLKKYGFSAAPDAATADPGSPSPSHRVLLRQHHELNDAVCALAAAGRRIQDLYRPVNDALRAVLSELM